MDRTDFIVFFHLCCTPDSLFKALVEWVIGFSNRFRKSLLCLSGLVGKECVEIRPVSIADGQPTCKRAERRFICVVYNAAVIPSFINDPTVQAEKPSCEIQYNYWLLPESRVCVRKWYGGSRADPSFPLTSMLRVSAAFKSDLKPVCLSKLLALILVLKIIESLRLENTFRTVGSNQ